MDRKLFSLMEASTDIRHWDRFDDETHLDYEKRIKAHPVEITLTSIDLIAELLGVSQETVDLIFRKYYQKEIP